jgi:bacteriocin-like protein
MNKLVKELSINEMSQVLGGKESKTIIRPDGSILIVTTEIKDDGTVVISRQEP